MRAVIAGLCCITMLTAAPRVMAGDQLVHFNSQPNGAWVCKKVLTKLSCDARTPARIPVTILQEGASSIHVLKRFGYKPHTVRVSAGMRTVDVALKPIDFLAEPAAYKDKKQAALQRAINPRLRQMVLSPESGYAFNLAGKISIAKGKDGKYALIMAVLINHQDMQKKLRRARRTRAKNERVRKIVDTIGDDGLFDLLDRVLVLANANGIDAVVLTVAFPATAGVLSEKKEVRYVTSFTGSTYRTDYYGRTTRTDHYVTRRKTEHKLTVQDRRAILEYAFVVPIALVDKKRPPASRTLLERMAIYTNDNRSGRAERVKYSR